MRAILKVRAKPRPYGVDARYRVAVPIQAANDLDLMPGDYVAWEKQENGQWAIYKLVLQKRSIKADGGES